MPTTLPSTVDRPISRPRSSVAAAMRHLGRTAGSRLIAEGVETAEEARTLTVLGVALAHCRFFGHPEPVETWEGARAAPGPGGALS